MHSWSRAGVATYFLISACSANTAPATASSTESSTSTTGPETTEDPSGTAPTTSTSSTSTGTGTSTGDSSGTSTGDPTGTSTGDASTGPIECIPTPDSDGSTTDTTGTTGTTGDPLVPIGSWQEYLVAECAALLECGCTAPQGLGTSLEVCMAIRTAELGDAAAQGLTWDPDCAALRVAGVVQRCAGEEAACAATTCSLFHGAAAHAQPCVASWGVPPWLDASTCAAELHCSDEVCVTPCSGEFGCDGNLCGPGQHCFHDDGDVGSCKDNGGVGLYCDPIFGPDCGPGLVCNVSDDEFNGMCIPLPAECEACTSLCASGSYCDPATKLCRAPAPVGAPCAVNAGCQSLSCGIGGQCDPFPGAGEPCPDGLCADGLVCGSPQLCYPIAQRDEPCPGGSKQCAPGLRCSATMVCEPLLCSYL